MSSGVPTNSARRTKSYAANQLVVAAGIKTSIATETSARTWTAADFNGSVILTGGVLDLPRTVTITLSNTVGAFTTNPIVLTGYRGGNLVTESLAPPNANGGVTLKGNQAFDTLESVALPAQGSTSGSYTIGVQDIVCPHGQNFSAVKLHADGNLNVRYGSSATAPTDVIPCTAKVLEPVAPTRILTDAGLSAPTTVGLTVYIP